MRKATRAQTTKDRLMNEKIIYGGLVYTRQQVILIMQAEKQDPRAIDYFVFHPDALPMDTPLDELLPADKILLGVK